jgi:starch-binding outer membrane protein, SusD/RagB family
MKKSFFYILMVATVLANFSCKKALDEDVRSQISDEYLNTPAGFQEGLNAGYNGLRTWYGQQSAGWLTVFGTDEYTYGAAEMGFDSYNLDINPTNATISGPWNSM